MTNSYDDIIQEFKDHIEFLDNIESEYMTEIFRDYLLTNSLMTIGASAELITTVAATHSAFTPFKAGLDFFSGMAKTGQQIMHQQKDLAAGTLVKTILTGGMEYATKEGSNPTLKFIGGAYESIMNYENLNDFIVEFSVHTSTLMDKTNIISTAADFEEKWTDLKNAYDGFSKPYRLQEAMTKSIQDKKAFARYNIKKYMDKKAKSMGSSSGAATGSLNIAGGIADSGNRFQSILSSIQSSINELQTNVNI